MSFFGLLTIHNSLIESSCLGLYDAVVMNPDLSDYVMDTLITHFNTYYETDPDIKPPLRFDLCSDIQKTPDAVLHEPIGDLIFVMQKIYVKMASQNSTSMERVAMILESLCARMTKTELEHLGFVKIMHFLI